MRFQAEQLFCRYGRHTVLEQISFSLPEGSFTVLVGPNGSGKSTLLSCLAGQLPYQGQIWAGDFNWSHCSARKRAETVAFLPQSVRAPDISVRDLISFGRAPYRTGLRSLSHRDLQLIETALRRTGLEPLACRQVSCLSGGERQRAFLAMLLAQDTPLLFLDEPTASLDPEHREQLLQLLRQLAEKDGKTVLAVLHDLPAAVRYAHRLLVLQEGRLCFDGSPGEFLDRKVAETVFRVRQHVFYEQGRPYALFSDTL